MVNKKAGEVLYFLVLAAWIVLGICIRESEDFDRIPTITGDGNFLIHSKHLVPRESPSVWAAEDGKLFVFFESAELLNVYSVQGEYLYGIQFPDARNGRSRLLFQDGLLYVDARGPGLYIFRETELIRFEEGTIHNEEYANLEEIFTGETDYADGVYTYSYSEKNNSFSRTGPEGTNIVLQLPQKKLGDFSWLTLAIVMLIAQHSLRKKPNDPESSRKEERLSGAN